MIGLLGAHRVGKSTLCQGLLQAGRGRYWEVPVSISQMQKYLGFDSSNQSYDWDTRKAIQLGLFAQFKELLWEHQHSTKIRTADVRMDISERTPLDLVGYLVINAPENLTAEDLAWIEDYKTNCINLTNEYYSKVFLVQPGIPYVECETSAKEDTIDKLNSVYLSMMLDSRLTVDRVVMDTEMTDLTQRILYVMENTYV